MCTRRRRQRLGLPLLAAAGIVLALALLISSAMRSCGPEQKGGPEEVRQALEKLTVSRPDSMSGYSRERFEHWSKANDFGWSAPQASCDSREAVLTRDGKNVTVGKDCKVISGQWLDPYTARTYTDPSDLDIDHVVPLAEAWRSGASSWDDKERERYANDPDVLLSVQDNANEAKGDSDPATWKPPNEDEWCDYAGRWIRIKARYELSVDEQEKDALLKMLGTSCPAAA